MSFLSGLVEDEKKVEEFQKEYYSNICGKVPEKYDFEEEAQKFQFGFVCQSCTP